MSNETAVAPSIGLCSPQTSALASCECQIRTEVGRAPSTQRHLEPHHRALLLFFPEIQTVFDVAGELIVSSRVLCLESPKTGQRGEEGPKGEERKERRGGNSVCKDPGADRNYHGSRKQATWLEHSKEQGWGKGWTGGAGNQGVPISQGRILIWGRHSMASSLPYW